MSFWNRGEADISWSEKDDEQEFNKSTKQRVVGKIVKLDMDGGWGFITSREIKFTRIFMHWTSLKQTTLKFDKLKRGMLVEFIPVEVPGKGIRAIQIEVIEDDRIK